MKRKPIDLRRRALLKSGSIAAVSLAFVSRIGDGLAQGAQPRLDEKDQQAQALGYKHDASKVDKAKFKNYQAGQTCANCNLYQGKTGDWGPCQIFPGKQVNAKGWCSAYQKKA
ncbi:MAG: hypothetical protein A3D95_09660 [Betaproteobacteria bacterium RIFCSPHIGHO2_12_FULL_69_13]|nr:MAG: hypothetical protein A3D95_09660 [Betaproteobacteria bacterium RIFCSPHIGHO2_12_FULL_69_13]OGA70282.1 MAG: hypothetical protein A3G83_05875 [Betaproteobacteria bacterium RIFCSPLOWO2_12_FULL_68_20]